MYLSKVNSLFTLPQLKLTTIYSQYWLNRDCNECGNQTTAATNDTVTAPQKAYKFNSIDDNNDQHDYCDEENDDYGAWSFHDSCFTDLNSVLVRVLAIVIVIVHSLPNTTTPTRTARPTKMESPFRLVRVIVPTRQQQQQRQQICGTKSGIDVVVIVVLVIIFFPLSPPSFESIHSRNGRFLQ